MRYEIFGDVETKSEYGIILPNHWAGSIDDSVGDRAQYLSEILDIPIIPFERPGTATLTFNDRSIFTVESYLEDVDNRAQKLQKVLDENGIETAVITSDSGGALDCIAIAATGRVAVKKVIAIEPVAMRAKTFTGGAKAISYFASQIRSDKRDIDSDEFRDLIELKDIRERSDAMSRRMLAELKAYWPVYSSDIGMKRLRHLSVNYPHIPVDLILGNKSKAMTPKIRANAVEEFRDSSVNVEILKAGHSFTDRHHYFLHIVKKSIESMSDDVCEPDSVS